METLTVNPNSPSMTEEVANWGRFEKELTELINRYSMENGSDTPDFILAQYMSESLGVFNRTMKQRTAWYGRS